MEGFFTGSITIDDERVVIRRTAGGEVWLTQWEIARLFGVFEAAVRANIRAIYRSEALRRGATQRIVQGVELYNLEMIAALSFRLRSLECEAFRRWLLRPCYRPNTSNLTNFIPQNESYPPTGQNSRSTKSPTPWGFGQKEEHQP